ncbi:MAG: STAS domain-containing protein [Phycisphaerales bacterium]
MVAPSHHLAGRDGEALVVTCPPELTHDSGEALLRAVKRHLPNRDHATCILDMSAVGLISSIGITVLLQADEHCADRAAKLYIAGLPERQRQFLRMLKLDAKFTFVPSVDEALALG